MFMQAIHLNLKVIPYVLVAGPCLFDAIFIMPVLLALELMDIAVNAINAAKKSGCDVVIIDTAGRLHTKKNLMEELKKIRRSVAKTIPDAPHETLMVVDATTGQNALTQAQLFHDAVGIDGVALTKLDGTAKGGIVIGICSSLNIPLQYIGIGEKIEDLRPFDAEQFIDALF